MTPVYAYQIRRREDGLRGELLLRLRHSRSAYIVDCSIEQARQLVTEMKGLASDHCPLHHMTIHLAQSLGAQISHIILQSHERFGEVKSVVCLDTSSGPIDVDVEPTAALSMALHMGLPIFMDGEFPQTDEGILGPVQKPDTESTAQTPIPEAFREAIEGIDNAASGDDS